MDKCHAGDHVSPEVLRQILRDLPVPHVEDPVLAQVYRIEHAQFIVPEIRKIQRDALVPTNNFSISISRVFDVTNTITLAEAFNARCVTNALTPWTNRDKNIEADAKALVTLRGIKDPDDFILSLMMYSFQKEDREGRKKWKQLEKLGRRQPNIFGKMLVAMIIPTSDKIYERSVKIRTEINMTRAFVALRIFEGETGKRAESLEELRSKALLQDHPGDLFSGKSVLYSRGKGILWSVGPDGSDNGGDPEKDFVIKLPSPMSEVTAH